MLEFFILRVRSFRHAFAGWWYVIRTQKNAWIHAILSIFVLLAALFLRLQARDMAVLILTIGTVWTAEFINTAIEAVVDLASPRHHPLARVGKDVGAAAVLIAAISAAVIGLLILGPPLWAKITSLFHQ